MTVDGRLCDAVNIARDLSKTVPGLVAAASFPPVQVNPLLREIVEKRLCKKHDLPEFPIVIRRFPIPNSSTRGHLLRYVDHAQINISDQCNECWDRFTICKELSHLIADTESQYLSGSLRAQLSFVSRMMFRPPLHQNEQFNSEVFAMHLAACIMMPWEMREVWTAMKFGGASNYKVAHRFKVPEAIVQIFMMDDYQAMWNEANETYNFYYDRELADLDG